MTLTELKTDLAILFELSSLNDLTVLSRDTALAALNYVRNFAEMHNNFEFSKKLSTIKVDGVTGGYLSRAVEYGTTEVTATLEDGAATEFVNASATVVVNTPIIFKDSITGGPSEGTQYYVKTVNGSSFEVSLTVGGTTAQFSSAGGPVTFYYNATFLNLGAIIDCFIVDDNSNFRPIEWTTVGESMERTRATNPHYAIRYPSDGDVDVEGRGRIEITGDRVYLFPRSANTTMRIGLHTYSRLADWVSADLGNSYAPWTTVGANYLYWAAAIHMNHLYKHFVFRQEGNLAPPTQMRDEALDAIVRWDRDNHETLRRHGR